MTYKITVDTSSAKSQARAVRAAFEAELKSIKVGQLDTSGIKAATGQAKALTAEMERAAKAGDLGKLDTSGIQGAIGEAGQLRAALEQAATAANNIKVPKGGGGSGEVGNALGSIAGILPGIGGLASAAFGGFAVGAVVAGLKELGQALDETARRGAVFGQLGDVLNSYTKSVGSSTQAFIQAGQQASAGTIAQYDLILNANRAIQFEVAKTSGQYAKLIELSSALGRAQGVSDTQALEYLTTGLARESKLILDNLGLIIDVEGVTSTYALTLGKTKDELSAAERKTALLNEAFRQGATALEANRDATNSAATQFERLDANAQNLRDTFGKLLAEASADKIGALSAAIELLNRSLKRGIEGDSSATTQETIDDLIAQREELQKTGKIASPFFGIPGFQGNEEEQAALYAALTKQIEELQGAKLGLLATETKLTQASKEQGQALQYQTSDMQGYLANQEAAAQKEAAAKAAAEAKVLAEEAVKSSSKELTARAEKSVETLGTEQALAIYRKAKTDADAAIAELTAAGVTDATEFGLRVSEIMTHVNGLFDAAESQANQIDFSALSTAFASLDTGFVDFLPGISAAREELASLSEEIAYSGGATDEQAARLEYLSAVAYSVGDSTSQLGQVTADLGYEFLSSNEYAAGLVDALYDAEASYRSGLISADTYAGVTAALSGKLLGLAQTAGIATGAIYALNSAQADMAATLPGGAQGRAVGDSIASRIQSRDSEKARDHNRRELDRYAKDQARATERSGARAGKSLEDGAKKASQELKSALQGVEGLFGASKVTQEDMDAAKAGTYKDKADEYLRRFRDEVENGKDWADVSLEQVRAGLEKAGLDAGSTAKETLANFEQSINDSSLFSAAENIPIFINEKAVKYALALQEKSAQGEKNIFEYFGVKVDEAVSASTGGGGGAVPVIRPPDLIDVDPITEGMQTGVDELVQKTTNKINEAFASTAGIDPVLGGIKTGTTVAYPKTIDLVADSTVKALVPLLTTASGKAATATVAPVLQPTIDTAAFQVELDKITASVAVTLYTTIEEIQLYKGILAATVKPAVSTTLALTDTAIFEYETTVAAKASPAISTTLYTSIEEIQLFKSIIAATVKPTVGVTLAVTTTEGSDAITPLITDLNTQIRTKQPLIANQGITIGQILMAGILAHFKGGQTAAGESAAPFADALMTNLSTQFTTTQNMFYAVGFLPAMGVESGFKAYAYEGLADSFMEKLTGEIRGNAASLAQRGGTMAGYVQSGFVAGFSSESFKAQLIAIGELMYTYIEIGILSKVNGSALTDAIGAKVIEDLATEMEKP